MANNPKKVKDPTEVALSAIQEALNISDPSNTDNDSDRDAIRNDARDEMMASDVPPPAYGDQPFDTRPGADRPGFDAIDESRSASFNAIHPPCPCAML